MTPVHVGAVALGGAAGSVGRYLVTLGVVSLGMRPHVGTLVVNIAGCLAGGFVLGLYPALRDPAHPGRALLIIGVLGGLTTFSAFGVETIELFREREAALATIMVVANLSLGFGAAWVGFATGAAVR